MPGRRADRQRKVGVGGGGGTAGFQLLVCPDVGGTADGPAGSPFGPGHPTADAGLDARHHGAHAHRSALAHSGHLAGGAPIAGLLKARVGGAGHHLAGAGFIAGHIVGAAGAGAAHHQIAVGDAEAHLGGLRLGTGGTELVVLLGPDVFVARDQAAAAGLIAGDLATAADVGAGDPRAPQRLQARHLLGRAARLLKLFGDVLATGELAVGAGFIAGHPLGAADHHPRNRPTGGGDRLSHLARVGGVNAAVGGILIRRDVLGAGDKLAGAGFIAGHLFGAAHLVTGDAVAMAGGAHPHLGGLAAGHFALTEGIKDFSSEVLGARDCAAGGRIVAGGFWRAVGLGAGHHLAGQGLADAHLEARLPLQGLLGAVAVGAGGAGGPLAGGPSRAHLAFEFAHLLGELTAAQIGVALTGHAGGAGAVGRVRGFAPLGQGLAAGQDKGSAGVVHSGTLGRAGSTLLGGASWGARGAAAAGKGQAVAPTAGALARCGLPVLALARVLGLGWDGRGSGCRARQVGAGAVLGGIGPLTAPGEGLPAGEHQLAAGVSDRLAGRATGWPPGGLGRSQGGRGGAAGAGWAAGSTAGRSRSSGPGSAGRRRGWAGGWIHRRAGRTGVVGCANASGGGAVTASGFLAAIGEGLAALKGCLTTRCAGHDRPGKRLTTSQGRLGDATGDVKGKGRLGKGTSGGKANLETPDSPARQLPWMASYRNAVWVQRCYQLQGSTRKCRDLPKSSCHRQ